MLKWCIQPEWETYRPFFKYLSESEWFKLKSFSMICGPKSPTTTKYVMHVPIKYPITHSSTINLPDEPKMYDAEKRRKKNTNCVITIAIISANNQLLYDVIMAYKSQNWTYLKIRNFFASLWSKPSWDNCMQVSLLYCSESVTKLTIECRTAKE